jgi:drug/metabolite transporter (DMT)-like permease
VVERGVFLLGVAAALFASVLFNLGLALQALEARRASKSNDLRVSLLWQLIRRPRWLLGQVLGTVGVAPQVYALSLAPFVIVQPLLAVGLVLLLAIGARVFDERVGPLGFVGVFAIIAGIGLVAWGAPAHSEAHRGSAAIVSVTALLAVLSLVPFALRGTRWDNSTVLMIAAGCGFAGTNVATKLLSDDLGLGHDLTAVAWGAVGLGFGVAATVTGMSAFLRRRATVVVPVTTAVQTYLPILLEPFFLREHWGSAAFDGAPIIVGVVVALVGTVLVTRTDAVADLAAAAQA